MSVGTEVFEYTGCDVGRYKSSFLSELEGAPTAGYGRSGCVPKGKGEFQYMGCKADGLESFLSRSAGEGSRALWGERSSGGKSGRARVLVEREYKPRSGKTDSNGTTGLEIFLTISLTPEVSPGTVWGEYGHASPPLLVVDVLATTGARLGGGSSGGDPLGVSGYFLSLVVDVLVPTTGARLGGGSSGGDPLGVSGCGVETAFEKRPGFNICFDSETPWLETFKWIIGMALGFSRSLGETTGDTRVLVERPYKF